MSRKTEAGAMIRAKAETFDFWSRPPVLLSEATADYEDLLKTLQDEVKPRGIIENMYVNEMTCLIWEILRLRRCRTALINTAFRDAIRTLLETTIRHADDVIDLTLAERWFTSKSARAQVLELLAKSQLDEAAIEAEALRRSFEELEILDKMLLSMELRRDRALGSVDGYRHSFAKGTRESSDRVIEAHAIEGPRSDGCMATAAE